MDHFHSRWAIVGPAEEVEAAEAEVVTSVEEDPLPVGGTCPFHLIPGSLYFIYAMINWLASLTRFGKESKNGNRMSKTVECNAMQCNAMNKTRWIPLR